MATASEQARYDACQWGINIASNNKYHYGRQKWGHKYGCPFCGTEGAKRKAAPSSQKWETEFTWCCNPFVVACYVHGANVDSKCGKGGLTCPLAGGSTKSLKSHKFEQISKSNMAAGDILLTPTHAMLYCGNNKVVHAAHHDNGGGVNNDYWKDSIKYGELTKNQHNRIRQVWRYKGNGRGKYKDNNVKLPATFTSNGEITDSAEGETSYSNFASMSQLTSKLVSSENYMWCNDVKPETSDSVALEEELSLSRQIASNAQLTINKITSSSSETIASLVAAIADKIKETVKKNFYQRVSSSLNTTDSLVEAPFVELDFDGNVIGVRDGADDKWPNLIQSMSVNKINGRINQYVFSLKYQIRAGEDPQKVDKLISKVKFGGVLKVRYGDCENGRIFRDAKLVITNVSQNRDYAGSSITYTINATSAGDYVRTYLTSFPTRKVKPSTLIEELLYSNSETSKILLDAFPGMANRKLVYSKGLLLNDDRELEIKQTRNVDVITYITSLVGSMQCETDLNASYFINYYEDENNEMGGAYFKIQKMTNTSRVNYSDVYNLTVGYPLQKDILSFTVNNSDAWSLLKDNSSVTEYLYTMENSGDIKKRYSKALASSVNRQTAGNANWWNFVTTYPITATMVLRGLTVPVMIGDYINIDVVFYGQKHMTSGLYMVTAQNDNLGGDGFKTTLNLVRTGND